MQHLKQSDNNIQILMTENDNIIGKGGSMMFYLPEMLYRERVEMWGTEKPICT